MVENKKQYGNHHHDHGDREGESRRFSLHLVIAFKLSLITVGTFKEIQFHVKIPDVYFTVKNYCVVPKTE